VQRRVGRADERRLVRPVVEEGALLVGEQVEGGRIDGSEPRAQDEQVRAGHRGGRIELQAAERLRGREDLRGGRRPGRHRAGQPLRLDRESSRGANRDVEAITGHGGSGG